MDPVANLMAQRARVAEINAITDRQASGDLHDTDVARIQVLAAQLAEHVEALDIWRTRGGVDPYPHLANDSSPTTPPREDMSWHLMAQLLDALMYRVPMEERRQVMHEVPAAYNAWYGRTIVVTRVVPAPDAGQAERDRATATGATA